MTSQNISLKAFGADSEFPPTTPGKLRLYSMRFCPFSQRARLVLAHKDIEYETVNINLLSKPDWFLVRNPVGSVPCLELDGKVVYESTAVCEWLDDVYTHNTLTPRDPYWKAKDRMLLEYFGKVTSVHYSVLFSRGDLEANKEELLKQYRYYENALTARGTPFFGGDEPAMVDFYLWPHMERNIYLLAHLSPGVEITEEKFPSLRSWIAKMLDVAAVKATLTDMETHLGFADTFLTGTADYDYKLTAN